MVSLITASKAQSMLAEQVHARRLSMELTQAGLAKRSGVPLPTLRKFEQKGLISLESFLKLLMVVGGLDDIVQAIKPKQTAFASIDDVLSADSDTTRKRGKRS